MHLFPLLRVVAPLVGGDRLVASHRVWLSIEVSITSLETLVSAECG